jgi:predicted Zn-dependent protease
LFGLLEILVQQYLAYYPYSNVYKPTRVCKRMAELDLVTLLQHWQRKLFAGAQYSYATVQVTNMSTMHFDDGSMSAVPGRTIFVRAAGDDGQTVRFHSASLEDVDLSEQRVKMCLALAEKDQKTPRIKVPQHKILARPTQSWGRSEFMAEPADVTDWPVPGELEQDLKRASKFSAGGLLPSIALTSESDTVWFVDGDGFSARWCNPSFRVEIKVPLYAGQEIKRYVGFAPTHEDQLPKIYELLKHVQDVTPDGWLQTTHNFTELTDRLSRLAATWKDGQPANVRTGIFPIITHMVTPAHEAVGHFAEEMIELERGRDEDPLVTYDDYFVNARQVGPDDLTVRDDPSATLHKLKLIGTTPIDMEGFPTLAKAHISRGIVSGSGTLGSRYSHGPAVGSAFTTGRMPQPRMTVTKTSPAVNGPETIEELLEHADVSEAIVGIWDHGFADFFGYYAAGTSDDPMNSREYHPKTAEAWLVRKERGRLECLPIKIPHVVVGLPLLSLRDIIVGGSSTLGYDPASCYCASPISEGLDRVKSSQVGPLVLMRNSVFRTYQQPRPSPGFRARR